MADRATLHLSLLDQFAAWAEGQGFVRRPPNDKHGYELLRLVKPGRRHPVIVYARGTAKEHASVLDRDARLVRDFVRSRHMGDGGSGAT